MPDPLFFDETTDEQQIGALREMDRTVIRLRLYAVADNPQLRRRKIAGKQRFANVLRDADDQRGLALQCLTTPLENCWNECPSEVLIFGRVASMKGHHQREPQSASDRQGERATTTEMGMDQSRLQHYEIR